MNSAALFIKITRNLKTKITASPIKIRSLIVEYKRSDKNNINIGQDKKITPECADYTIGI